MKTFLIICVAIILAILKSGKDNDDINDNNNHDDGCGYYGHPKLS